MEDSERIASSYTSLLRKLEGRSIHTEREEERERQPNLVGLDDPYLLSIHQICMGIYTWVASGLYPP